MNPKRVKGLRSKLSPNKKHKAWGFRYPGIVLKPSVLPMQTAKEAPGSGSTALNLKPKI